MEAMKNTLLAAFNFWKKDKTCQRLSLWAFLENKENTSNDEVRLVIKLTEYLASLQQKGYFPDDLHRVVFLTMIIGSIQFWVRYKKRFINILKPDMGSNEFDNMFLEQFGGILKNILFQRNE